MVLLVEAVPHVEWGIPLAVALEWEPEPCRKICGLHGVVCLVYEDVTVSFSAVLHYSIYKDEMNLKRAVHIKRS